MRKSPLMVAICIAGTVPFASAVDQLTDGTLIRRLDDNAVWVIHEGHKELIPNMGVFNARGYRPQDVRRLTPEEIDPIPSVIPHNSIIKYHDGTRPEIYWVMLGEKHKFPDMATFNALGFHLEDVARLADREIDNKNIPTGSDVVPPPGPHIVCALWSGYYDPTGTMHPNCLKWVKR